MENEDGNGQEQPPKPEAGLELHINSSAVEDPTVPVRWCLKKPAVDYLVKQKGGTTMILLTQTQAMSNEDGEEIRGARRLIPLGEAMAYLQLRRAGDLTIHAILIHSDAETWRIKNLLLSCNADGSYEYELFYRGNTYRYASLAPTPVRTRNINITFVTRAQIGVHIEFDLFAKDPPAWLKSYVNWLHDRLPIDECAFRKRMIIAFTIQPITWAAWSSGAIVVKAACALWLLLSGWQHLDLKDAVPPVWSWSRFNEWIKESPNNIWHSVWWHRSYNDDRKKRSIFRYSVSGRKRPFFFQIWQPTFWPLIISGALTMIHLTVRETRYDVGATLGDGVMFLLTILCLLTLPSIIAYSSLEMACWVKRIRTRRQQKKRAKQNAEVVNDLGYDPDASAKEKKERRRREEELKKRQTEAAELRDRIEMEARLKPLVCTGQVITVDLEHAPRRTVRLRFEALKARVCRPYAR